MSRAGAIALLLLVPLGVGVADSRATGGAADPFAAATEAVSKAADLSAADQVVLGGDPADGYFTMRLELATKEAPSLAEVLAAYRGALVAPAEAASESETPATAPTLTLEEVPATTPERARYRLFVSDGRKGIVAIETKGAQDGGALPRAVLSACVWNDREPVAAEAACQTWLGTL